jgi:hypothetical protein
MYKTSATFVEGAQAARDATDHFTASESCRKSLFSSVLSGGESVSTFPNALRPAGMAER